MTVEYIDPSKSLCNQTLTGLTPEIMSKHTFRNFAHLCDDQPYVLKLSEHDFQILKQDAVLSDRMGIDVHPDRVEDWSIYTSLCEYLKLHPQGIFAKVADASPKENLQPLFTAEEVWRTLVSSKRVLTFLTHHQGDCDLVLRPWNMEITLDNEFRVFYSHGKCVGISQQHCYRKINVEDPAVIFKAIHSWLEEHKLPYDEVVLDMYVFGGVAHLIECNPWYVGSGSSLFTWSELTSLLTCVLRLHV